MHLFAFCVASIDRQGSCPSNHFFVRNRCHCCQVAHCTNHSQQHKVDHQPCTAPEYVAQSDLYLSPESRLLVDSVQCEGEAPAVWTFDGHGHRLVLPPPSAVEQQAVPLILVGPGRTLRLRNVRVIHAASLPRCVQLAPGACICNMCTG